MAIEAGRMVVSAGNIEWLNFDFTKAMPPKELITGYSTFDIQPIEGNDTLEVDVTYGAQDRVFEELNFRLPSIKSMQLVSKVIITEAPDPDDPNTPVRSAEFATLDENTHYYEFDPGLFIADEKLGDVQTYRLENDAAANRYAKHPTPFIPVGTSDYLFYREVDPDLPKPVLILSDTFMRSSRVGDFDELTYALPNDTNTTNRDSRRYDPQYPTSLIEIYHEEEGENKDKPFVPPRYRIFHAFETLPVNEQKTNATDPTRKIVSLAVRGKAKLGPDGLPERKDNELDSIWLVNCRIRTSPGGLTRSGSMLVVGSG